MANYSSFSNLGLCPVPALLTGTLLVGALVPSAAEGQRARLSQYGASELASDGFAVSRPDAMRKGSFAAQLQLDYANDPLVWEANVGSSGSESAAIVQDHLIAHPVFAWGATDWLFVHATLPVNLIMSGDDGFAARVGAPPADGFTLSDPVLGARAHFYGDDRSRFQAGANLSVTAPLGRAIDGDWTYSGYDWPTVRPELLGEVSFGSVRVGANVGVRIASSEDVGNLELGTDLTYALGATILDIGTEGLQGHAELHGTSSLRDPFAREVTPIEGLLGGKFLKDDGWSFGLAVGLGLQRGFGSPDGRVVGLVGYAPPRAIDSDGDGLLDPDDACPHDPEDKDGFEDADGCSDPDNDGDGILDVSDQCPNEPETVNGWEDQEGCPDEVPDTDGDGLNDLEDQCVEEPEDKDQFEDDNGCPDPDNDGDGVLDVDDACINEPGVVEAQGCKPPEKVKIEGDQIVILEKVHFKLGSHKIEAVSFPLLDNVAEVIIGHPEIGKVRVEGHTDSRGKKAYNTKLSRRRAAEVRKYLTSKGVDGSRLVSRGFGPSRPIVDSATTEEEHAQNRRVEFHILERDDSAAAGAESGQSEEEVR